MPPRRARASAAKPQQPEPKREPIALYPQIETKVNEDLPTDIPADEILNYKRHFDQTVKQLPYYLKESAERHWVVRYSDSLVSQASAKTGSSSDVAWDLGWPMPTELMARPPKRKKTKTFGGDLQRLSRNGGPDDDEDEDEDEGQPRPEEEYDEEQEEEGGDYLASYFEDDDDTYERAEGGEEEENF
ncbi:hypothetical protein PTSG_03718 [Salpingoeca rosetta]|uniref:DNA-directed RNA polymerase III subunit n=1 Tax=Salpingoeca rosetta (strain ATCC 50818 / BSB-021) TaxID=946362 RepID=F2U6D9_SALR5|nr:uncharacterized protein PTSG_03718 [Salpingoeca rosetta]EGD83080.1 hypothetical protein PTSG_03718 [Salpingoeca rosetta]|eukprot:XP_004995444.1 hypothetical protein PTSG_03718 [Salpingoeca rosetta]